jgi:integrase/recombinase XerD
VSAVGWRNCTGRGPHGGYRADPSFCEEPITSTALVDPHPSPPQAIRKEYRLRHSRSLVDSVASPRKGSAQKPLADHDGGGETTRGYTLLSAANQVRLLAHVSRWLQSHGLRPEDLTSETVEQFLRSRRRAGYTAWRSVHGLVPLLGYLRRVGAAPTRTAPVAKTGRDLLLDRYAEYLRRERGLVAATVAYRLTVARRFLDMHAPSDRPDLRGLAASDVTGFVLRAARSRCIGSAKSLVSHLRSFLRFLYIEGLTRTPLAAAAPAVAGRRLTTLPRSLPPQQVARLLRSCDRRTAVGRRNFAILLLLVRLGLRAGEVAALRLDDFDWRRGDVVIRGKGQRQERLPLPVDVGEALIAYLRRGRPHLACRNALLRVQAPQGPLSSAAVTAIVRSASTRSGLPCFGAHRLRHTAATEMLRRGASLPEIGQVLRHRSLMTTAIYAKVDRAALRELAQPWPGGDA